MPTTTSPSLPLSSRVLHSRALPVTLALVAVSAGLLAVVVESEAVDTLLGAVCGAALVLALFAALVQGLRARAHRHDRDEQDLQGLDALEPLRAARRDSREQPR